VIEKWQRALLSVSFGLGVVRVRWYRAFVRVTLGPRGDEATGYPIRRSNISVLGPTRTRMLARRKLAPQQPLVPRTLRKGPRHGYPASNAPLSGAPLPSASAWVLGLPRAVR
jgi:hypothetical protein